MADLILPHALPELFSGDQPDKPWRDWLRHFEACARALNWTNEIKLRYLPARLRGCAGLLWSTLPEDAVDTYDHAVAALGRHFHPAEDRRLVAAQYRTRVQQADESLPAFATALRRLAIDALPAELQANLRDQLVLERFVDGLRSQPIRQRLREDWPADLDAAIARSLQLQAAERVEHLASIPSGLTTTPTTASLVAATQPVSDASSSDLTTLVKDLADSHLALTAALSESGDTTRGRRGQQPRSAAGQSTDRNRQPDRDDRPRMRRDPGGALAPRT